MKVISYSVCSSRLRLSDDFKLTAFHKQDLWYVKEKCK